MTRMLPFGLSMVFLACAAGWAASAELPSFPGAEGFGAASPGGRGGRVIHVTNLNTDGPGSLQAALSTPGPRIVVFDTSGVIPGNVYLDYGQVTIAGQSAPGAGITIKGLIATDHVPRDRKIEDVVIRFLRLRPDPNEKLDQSGDGIRITHADRVLLDHMSIAWSSDETIDVFTSNDVTVQWCTVDEGDTTGHEEGVHNYGLIQGPNGHRISVHHNLFAHHKRRNPAVANGPADVINNLVYNFRDGFLHDNKTNDITFNIIGNYYKRGPSDPQIFPFCFSDGGHYYLRDNWIEGTGMIQDPWAEKDKHPGLAYYAAKGTKAEKPSPTPPIITHDPREAYELVLERAGCFPRDILTREVIEDVKAETGSWGRRYIPDLMAGLSVETKPADTDNDGIPDRWENDNSLDSANGEDYNTLMPSGYTAVEEYLNAVAEALIIGN
ncbi:polysaccharide lyase family 1 protein [Gemmatimonadota bacterium]